MPNKRYYDFFSYLATQLAFSFATAPFLILSFSNSILVWSRVSFYAVIGVIASIAFFASPAKPYLRRRLEERAARAGAAPAGKTGAKTASHVPGRGDVDGGLRRSVSAESVRETVLGLPTDPERELDEAMSELRAEVQARHATFKKTD